MTKPKQKTGYASPTMNLLRITSSLYNTNGTLSSYTLRPTVTRGINDDKLFFLLLFLEVDRHVGWIALLFCLSLVMATPMPPKESAQQVVDDYPDEVEAEQEQAPHDAAFSPGTF